MKKVIRCLGMMALVALAFTSCKKVEKQSTFTATMPELVAEDEDRAYIDGNTLKVMFETNDRIMVFNISKNTPLQSECATYKVVQGGNQVTFTNGGGGSVGAALDGGYYAYYPCFLAQDPTDPYNFIQDQIINELAYGENKSKFFVSPQQEYRENLVARRDFYLAGHHTQEEAPFIENTNFEMKSICGVLQLKPYEAAQRRVTNIEVIDQFFHLTGWVEMIIPECDVEEMTDLYNRFDPTNTSYLQELNEFRTRTGYNVSGTPEEFGKSVTLNMPEGGIQLGNTKATTPAFNIVLRPLALTYGCHIIFTFDDGTTKDIDLSTKNLKIKPNVVKSVGLNMDNY